MIPKYPPDVNAKSRKTHDFLREYDRINYQLKVDKFILLNICKNIIPIRLQIIGHGR